MDYEYAKFITLECKQCDRKWRWPWPYGKKKPYNQPENCPECRNKEIEMLNKHIELLNEIHDEQVQRVKWKIDRLVPHSKEVMLRQDH